MTELPRTAARPGGGPVSRQAPFLRAPERARTLFLVTFFAACGPLAAGVVVFGWRAAAVAGLSIFSCALVERVYYRVTRTPALLGRSHAFLTGLLLALTLPAYVPWYVPVTASVFAIVVGKGVFGGVGHFLWQPALVGRLAVAVVFPALLSSPEPYRPVLAQPYLLTGDLRHAKRVPDYRRWEGTVPRDAEAIAVIPPRERLAGLTRTPEPAYSALEMRRTDIPRAKPGALLDLPPLRDLLLGVRPGDIGETSVIVILVAGLYLVYRNYVRAHLPLAIVVSAWLVAALAPIQLAGPGGEVRWLASPLGAAGTLGAGVTYANYQLLSGAVLLAAFFLAPETTSRPVTAGGQVIFGVGVGALAMGLQLYVDTPIPAYVAVLAMNTFTPLIDAVWRPRVLGQLPWYRRLRRRPA